MLPMVKAPRDHARLARAFGVAPTRRGFAIVATTGAAFVGMFATGGLLIAGGLVAGFGALAVGDHRTVQKALREVEAWGFPVEGYRAWMLADEPTFEFELARDVDLDVLATSVRAIDPMISVVRVRERAFRVTTRRVALPSPHKDGTVFLVGDRQLLHELHVRVLAPLHADVGITRMRMGDRASLPAAPASLPAPSDQPGGGGMGAFREQALAAPPALQALVDLGADRELPREARKLPHRAERVVYATGSAPHGFGTVAAFTLGGLTSGAGWFELIGMGVGAVAGAIGGTVAAIQGNRRNARKIADSVYGHGVPIEGYDDWLISGRPLFDIELATAIDPTWLVAHLDRLPRAFSVSANAEVSWIEEIKWLGDKLVRIETRPTLIEPASSRIAPFYGGSHAMFSTFVAQVLGPLHAHAGVVAVRMGGYITRRV
jgi:hypothetical protein